MRTRHRVPSIFNLYMVDVLCCALGCVILLLLLHVYRARAYERNAKETTDKQDRLLDDAFETLWELDQEVLAWQDKYAVQADELAALAAELKKANLRLVALDTELKDKDQALKDEKARAAGLAVAMAATEKELAQARADRKISLLKLSDLEKKLVAGVRDLDEAEKVLEGLRKTRAALEKELEKSGKSLAALMEAKAALEKKQDADAKKLDALERAKTLLAADLARRDKDLAAALTFKDKHADAEDRIVKLLKQLGEVRKDLELARGNLDKAERDKRELQKGINTLEVEKRGLQAEARRIEAEAANRFAGIELTGRRVIFLIDASGSMNMLDRANDAPRKWEEVQKTVSRLMRSMPKLEKFQILVFSPTTRYLLGQPGRWIDFDKGSVDAVVKALAGEKPSGGTNLYLPLEEAFKFRGQGLDTVYLLSDGLPDRGPGLTVEPPATTSAQVEALTRTIRNQLINNWNVKKVAPRVRINTVGFFYESPDVGSFLWALARENEGSFVGMSKP